ncbi:hypothetical protein F0562_021332 [Nyssa sinensis]|uniref:Uncharacterized protein n=1 Tax=Nyssa sinensis TaxID=561372 RepID=A0A5J5BJ64_9ASTE|nr:hypothetical protein F0562_021332 [Nyssa sinensis]
MLASHSVQIIPKFQVGEHKAAPFIKGPIWRTMHSHAAGICLTAHALLSLIILTEDDDDLGCVHHDDDDDDDEEEEEEEVISQDWAGGDYKVAPPSKVTASQREKPRACIDPSTKLMNEMEKNRLFWESCLES